MTPIARTGLDPESPSLFCSASGRLEFVGAQSLDAQPG
jgi:hypothetical protein